MSIYASYAIDKGTLFHTYCLVIGKKGYTHVAIGQGWAALIMVRATVFSHLFNGGHDTYMNSKIADLQAQNASTRFDLVYRLFFNWNPELF